MPSTITRIALALSAPFALAACASAPWAGPTEITRFSAQTLDEAPRGRIAVTIAPGEEAGGLAMQPYIDAVTRELAALGYDPVATGGSQVAEVRAGRGALLADGSRRSPVSVGVGGSTGTYGSGVGVGIGINLGGGPRETVDTSMAVVIRDMDTREVLWEGRASFAATTNADEYEARNAADKLASALFAGFPGNSGETIEVE
ncbi:DUF4136 domain-containing protein [Pseudoblastomonas halimionae]|uniref:DUF4136 domain-containing protein n=1 Tax=Alteriqipengyuania halimionae TaxID=1926630 RepID=A0A6I4U3E8_9SPHN|nr:DUF4136 domain-containing protein [Alteriqipengyuania halimionae]MXP10256.1 hypothetical protein [Alteriqipengyuania halimionae]